MKTTIQSLYCLIFIFLACHDQLTPIQQYGQHYQQHTDFYSLAKVVDLLPSNADTNTVKKLLGDPIDMGFDYRYLVDSTGEKGCSVGAVFHISDGGIIDQKWTGEICE